MEAHQDLDDLVRSVNFGTTLRGYEPDDVERLIVRLGGTVQEVDQKHPLPLGRRELVRTWLGIESDGSETFLDPVGYETLDETGFPLRPVWHAAPLVSEALTAFSRYASDDGCYDAYDYGVTLAWTALLVRQLRPSPPPVPVLAGFGGGDWLVFPAVTARRDDCQGASSMHGLLPAWGLSTIGARSAFGSRAAGYGSDRRDQRAS
jgi:hypothetical protein